MVTSPLEPFPTYIKILYHGKLIINCIGNINSGDCMWAFYQSQLYSFLKMDVQKLTWASCSCFRTGLSESAFGSPMQSSIFLASRPAQKDIT